MMNNQYFGVEIEMTGINRMEAAQIVKNVLGCEGEVVVEASYDAHCVFDNEGRKWKLERDASIVSVGGFENKVELVTPVLSYNDIKTVQTIVRALRAAGAVTNSSCGIHIHVDGAPHNAKSLANMVKFFRESQGLIYEGLKVRKSRQKEWCCKILPYIVDAIDAAGDMTMSQFEKIWYSSANDGRGYQYHGGVDHSHYNITRYHALNLHAMFTKGTVEFRLFNSCLYANRIKAYIQFCLAVSEWALKFDGDIKATQAAYKAERNTEERKSTFENVLKMVGIDGDEFAKTTEMLTAGFVPAVA